MYNSRLHNERLSRIHNVPCPHILQTDHSSLAIKTITLPLAIASGLSVGKEGPSVHVAVCAGHTISRLFRLSKSAFSMREIYAASSAAGVAVAFGAPIGGVIFSLEEMMSFGGNVGGGTVGRGFLMALVACMVVRGINPFWTGGLVMFEVHYERDWHFFEVTFPFPSLSPIIMDPLLWVC
jgi:chloride channel 3/4/5